MANSEKTMQEKLLSEFPPVTDEQWREAIEKDLKGADYNKKLVWRPLEGFQVQPFYRAEDIEPYSYLDTQPGQFPYMRGNHTTSNSWRIRQDIDVDMYIDSNRIAQEYLSRGADSIGYHFEIAHNPDVDDIRTLLKGFDPETHEVNLLHAGRSDHYFDALVSALTSMGDQWKKMSGSVGFSQLSFLTKKGRVCPSHGGPVNRARHAMEVHRELPNFQTLSVDGCTFHNAGATAVQELAFTLAMAVQYLEWLTDAGENAGEVARNIRFNFSISSTYFMEIAKLRAARLLWSRIVRAYPNTKDEDAKMIIHAETSRWNQTVYDPYVNILRASTESMSAVLGGVHSLCVNPFDTPYAKPSDFSARIARNIQLLLREEAYFDKVVDPSGGSYYIETLTHSVAQAAWDLFLKVVDEQDGFLLAYRSGFIRKAIEEVADTRRKRIATRRDTLLGTNQFPNFKEHASEETIREVMVRFMESDCGCSSGAENACAPLQHFRGSMPFELLRFRTDVSGDPPKAFMLTLGNLAMRRARAQFSCNFLACAGIEVIDNIGFESVEEGLKEARKAESKIIVLCSSDDEYAELAPVVHSQLQEGEILIIAGDPACRPELEKIGINRYINVRSNLLETLTSLQEELSGKA